MTSTYLEMEVKSCKIADPNYYIWFKKGQFHIEDVDFQKILSLSKTQLEWFIGSHVALVKEPDWKFFGKTGNDGTGITKPSKISNPPGWFLRCVARSTPRIQSFIHIFSGDSRQGWFSFHNMIRIFLMNYNYTSWQSTLQSDLILLI